MSDLSAMFEDDSVKVASNTELEEISKLAELQRTYERNIQFAESKLEDLKNELKNIQERLLPEAMLAVGMTEFKLADGSKITVKEDVYASIRKEFTGDAIRWLDSVGLGDVVKDKVAVDFGRGEADNAKALIAFCAAHGFSATESLSVHPSTLKALVKEQMAHGVQFPEEFFSIAPVRKSIIKGK